MKNALHPTFYPPMPAIAGVQLATARTGMRYKGRDDLLLIHFPEGAAIAGVFTQSSTAAPPVRMCQQHIKNGHARAIIVNAGNANAFTHAAGMEAAKGYIFALAEQLGCSPEEIFPCSTGVIGEQLKGDLITQALPAMLAHPTANWVDAATAIRTTDAFVKYGTRSVKMDDENITIHAITKGAGMIAPNMATMLSFMVTDASLPSNLLQEMLGQHAKHTFNAVSVDGDTSTNDTVLLSATGKRDARYSADALLSFSKALHDLMLEQALMLVRDGEGATKLAAIHVHEAASESSAKAIARSIAESPLVKTALAGSDPNWGRIVMAVGKSGEPVNSDTLWIKFGDHLVAEGGMVHPSYKEETGATYFKQPELDIHVGVGIDSATAVCYGCDMGHSYITINADYRS